MRHRLHSSMALVAGSLALSHSMGHGIPRVFGDATTDPTRPAWLPVDRQPIATDHEYLAAAEAKRQRKAARKAMLAPQSSVLTPQS